MAATAFATSEPLQPPELEAATVHYPRPSALEATLSFEGAKTRRAAETLGLVTVEDLLLHLPRDRREARAVAELVPGDNATVVVQVRSISSRSVRRRGMRPLVEATVADDSGAMKATFFNQPWLEQRYPVGTRLALHGKFEGRREIPGPGACADGGRGWRRWDGRALPRDRGAVLDPDPCARPRAPGRVRRRGRAVAGARAGQGAAARPGRSAARGPFRRLGRRARARPPPPGVRRAAARATDPAAPASAEAGREHGSRDGGRARADRAVARGDAAVHA